MRTPTGIIGLDTELDGGIPQGAIVLLAGEPGVGKTVFSIQFVLAGIAEGEPGVIGTSEDPEALFELANSLGWDLRAAVDDGYASIVQFSMTDEYSALSTEVSETDGNLNQVLRPMTADESTSAMIEAINEIRAERVALDKITTPFASYESSREFVGRVTVEVANRSYCTTLLTGFRPHQSLGYTALGVEEQISDGIIDMQFSDLSGVTERILSVRKMHGTQLDLSEHLYEIQPGRGVIFV